MTRNRWIDIFVLAFLSFIIVGGQTAIVTLTLGTGMPLPFQILILLVLAIALIFFWLGIFKGFSEAWKQDAPRED